MVDALEELSRREAFKDGTKLFTPYFKQKERLSQGLTSLGGRKFHDLDSFKFIPMEMDGVQRFPDAEWYIHIDADSYILLSNLAKYLKTLNSNAHHYLGHIAWLGHVPFAHGGSVSFCLLTLLTYTVHLLMHVFRDTS